jgi:four helix bundle protein
MTKSLVLEKAIKFALRVVKLYRYLSEEKTEYVLSKQVLLSGTHVAKFIKDATQAESKQFFATICKSRSKRLRKPSSGF